MLMNTTTFPKGASDPVARMPPWTAGKLQQAIETRSSTLTGASFSCQVPMIPSLTSFRQ